MRLVSSPAAPYEGQPTGLLSNRRHLHCKMESVVGPTLAAVGV
jgi:hypothetical protein